jgi:hypothetical protein
MKFGNGIPSILTLLLCSLHEVGAFTLTKTTTTPTTKICLTTTFSTTTDNEKVTSSSSSSAGVPPATSEASANIEDADIPTNLPSDCGMDYIPLATMLATGQLAEADQVRKLYVIKIYGDGTIKISFFFFLLPLIYLYKIVLFDFFF